jgi:dTDP-4-dehydrorhamnose 3,5-epimerase
MRVEPTKLEGILLITPDTFKDSRGTYVESYNAKEYYPMQFVQDDFSISKRNVLRGIHGDSATWKLVSCPVGSIFLAVVNWDKDMPQYGQYWTCVLGGSMTYQQVLIPPKFGNGHLVLSDMAVFHYKQSTYYNPSTQFSIPYNDPRLDIPWPILLGELPITSERDRRV